MGIIEIGNPRNRGSIRYGGTILPPLHRNHTGYAAHAPSYSMETADALPRDKAAGE
jgi:hypothetical protein